MSNDNTKVNELGQQILDAIDIIALSRLNSISFDKTITCTITNDEKRKEGEYEVSDGSVKFKAYSTDDGYRKDDVVYVTIPQGDYNNQKLIISKKTDDIVQPMIFKMPFDNIFDMTGNLAATDKWQPIDIGALLANDVQVNDNGKPILIEGGTTVCLGTLGEDEEGKKINFSNYTRLGIKADFKTWVAEAVQGSYGLRLKVTTEAPNAVPDKEGKQKDGETTTTTHSLIFNVNDMYGNPYNYETFYSQEKVFNISEFDKITKIEVYFYQNGDFYDKQDNPISAVDASQSRLWENLYVDNLYLCLGYDINTLTDDYVEIFTQNSSDYAPLNIEKKEDIESNELDLTPPEQKNKKFIQTRWVHIDDEGTPRDMVNLKNNDLNFIADKPFIVRWYRYHLGAAAADEYSGVYWDIIQESLIDKKENQFEEKYAEAFQLDFIPDINNQQEKIKAIILYNCIYQKNEDGEAITDEKGNCQINSAIPYHSNEIIFINQVPPENKETQHLKNALNIVVDDGTNGNYLIYGQDNSIKDTKYGDEIRTLSAEFDADLDGVYESKITSDELIWTFPSNNTMIVLNGNSKFSKVSPELISYTKGTYYIKDENGDFPQSPSNDKFDVNKVYYKKNDDNTYVQINNFYKPNTYYIMSYESQTDKVFDVNAQYYKKDGDNYIPVEKVLINDFNQDKGSYYLRTFILDGGEVKRSEDYYFYDNKNNVYIGRSPSYKINKTYSAAKTNNTVTCQYTLNGITYNSEIEFTFGPAGTMGTDQTLVIDFLGDTNAIDLDDLNTSVYHLKVRIYDKENKELTDKPDNITWSWYHTDGNLNLSNTSDQTCIITLNKTIVNGQEKFTVEHGQLYIIKVNVGDLETYYPIALKSDGASYIEGPTQIIYMSDGTINYQNVPYKVFKADKSEITDQTWSIVNTDKKNNSSYIGELPVEAPYKLKPLGIYVRNAPVYGVKCSCWTQPILILQNKWPNGVINAWDGKSLQLNENDSTILANAIAAGEKDDENRFSGVMLGTWKGKNVAGDIKDQTGVYGFHQGAMSYAFKEDGTAFIGKSGLGRIEFNGNKGVIQSASWGNPSLYPQTQIDLTNSKIELLGSSTNYIKMDATNSTYPIELSGSLRIDLVSSYKGHIGEIQANIPKGDSDTINTYDNNIGIGFKLLNGASEISALKATNQNVGMCYTDGGYISINSSGLSMGSENLGLYCSNDGRAASKIIIDKNHIGMWIDDVGFSTFGKDENGNNKRQFLMKMDASKIIADDTHIGMWVENTGWLQLDKSNQKFEIVFKDNIGSSNDAYFSIQKDNGVFKMKLWNVDADNQEGIYARFA